MDYQAELGSNSVQVADVLAQITDSDSPDAVLVDARAVLTYVAIVAQEIVHLAVLEPQNVDFYEAQARPVLLIGDAIKKYVELRSVSVPDTLDGIEGVG